jgi:kynureninase
MTSHDLRQRAVVLDSEHVTTDRRDQFTLPPGVVYLDGNSLGALSTGAREAVSDATSRQWGEQLIRAWNESDWWGAPERVGDRIGQLIGAAPGQVVVSDSTSVNLFKVLVAASRLRPGRSTVLTDPGSFPTDLYVTRSVCDLLGLTLELVPPAQAAGRARELRESLAVASYSHVDYRTGELWDLVPLTHEVHAAGGLVCWDLCHSAGVHPVGLDEHEVDLAVGCGYKYLSGGPGAPSFVHVARRHHEAFDNVLAGWQGHARPFDMAQEYEPAPGITRARVGTAPVLSLVGLEGALTAYDGLDVREVRRRSLSLTCFFLTCLDELDVDVDLATPREDARRGSQVSLRHPEGYAVVQALIARGVIGDFREPDIVRLGFAPLYLSHEDVLTAAEHVHAVVAGREYDRPEFSARHVVT